MGYDIKALCSQLNYSNVENTKLEKAAFQNSQNIFDAYDTDKNGILDENEVNNFFYTVDVSDGKNDANLTSESINKYIANSQYGEKTANELVEFTNQIFNLTQEQDINIDLYSSLGNQEQPYTNPDGKINDFNQGSTIGDCWFLSQAKALSTTSWGEDLIYDAISQNKNGDYLVSFDGVDEKIQITKNELNEALSSGIYSKGDADMVLLEVAMEKYLTNHIEDNDSVKQKNEFAQNFANQGYQYNILSSNYLAGETSLQYVLSKNEGKYVYAATKEDMTPDESIKNLLEEKAKNSESCAIMCGLDITDNIDSYAAKGLVNSHAYGATTYIDDNGNLSVSLINPHNTNAKIDLSYEEFANIVDRISIVENQVA